MKTFLLQNFGQIFAYTLLDVIAKGVSLWICFSGPAFRFLGLALGKLGKLLDGSWPTCLQKEFPSKWIPFGVDHSSHLGFFVKHTQDVFKQPGQSPNPER